MLFRNKKKIQEETAKRGEIGSLWRTGIQSKTDNHCF